MTHPRAAQRLRGWLRAVWPHEQPPLTLSFERELWCVEPSSVGLTLYVPQGLLEAFTRSGERGEKEVMAAIGGRIGALLTTELCHPLLHLRASERDRARDRALKRFVLRFFGEQPPSPLLMSFVFSSIDIMRGASWLLNAQPGLYNRCHQSVHTCRLMSWPTPPKLGTPSPTFELLWALCVPLLSRCPVSAPPLLSEMRSYGQHTVALSRLHERASRENSLIGRALSGALSQHERARIEEALSPWGGQTSLTSPTLLLDPLSALSALLMCEQSAHQTSPQEAPQEAPQERLYPNMGELREGWGEVSFGEGEEGEEGEEGDKGVLATPPLLKLSALSERVEDHIAQIMRALEPLKPPPRSLKRGVCFESGREVSLGALMASEAQPNRARKVWLRYGVPRRSERVSLLLVDLSASMKGPRLEAALEGVALFALSLARAEQPFALFGFQDELIELLSFDSPKPTSLKGLEPVLSALSDEVWGVREGGHNQPQYNDDGPCLVEAAAHLEAHARRCGAHSTQALWVISDGEPRGARSGAEALLTATAQLSADPRLDLYALGLGEGTEHVTRFYPRAEACVPLEGLVGALGRLMTPFFTKPLTKPSYQSSYQSS